MPSQARGFDCGDIGTVTVSLFNRVCGFLRACIAFVDGMCLFIQRGGIGIVLSVKRR